MMMTRMPAFAIIFAMSATARTARLATSQELQVALIQQCLAAVNEVILGKSEVTATVFATVLARGSILIEDRPGLGKTTLAKSIAKILGLKFQRVQCTNDLLPMDILGRVALRNPSGEAPPSAAAAEPQLIEGPIFASVVILDELNRAPARTQSAFLQAMEEGEVTIEGVTKALPTPQIIIATQNPTDHIGTTLLPESELDRFTVGVRMGYPAREFEKVILRNGVQEKLERLSVQMSAYELTTLQNAAHAIKTSDTFLDLVVRFLEAARQSGKFLSSRAGRDLVRLAKAFALMEGRDFALPEDFKRSIRPVVQHRVRDADELAQNFSFNV
ncbi:MAG: AAA family ATPase [Bdellovibrio sp.]|nr:MAG: AAA family ATPase [Bdellovibrio sp.]